MNRELANVGARQATPSERSMPWGCPAGDCRGSMADEKPRHKIADQGEKASASMPAQRQPFCATGESAIVKWRCLSWAAANAIRARARGISKE